MVTQENVIDYVVSNQLTTQKALVKIMKTRLTNKDKSEEELFHGARSITEDIIDSAGIRHNKEFLTQLINDYLEVQ